MNLRKSTQSDEAEDVTDMKRRKIHCLNPISKLGTGLFPEEYEIVDSAAEADGILVRSASMHEMEFSRTSCSCPCRAE